MQNYFMGRFATLREKVDVYTREIMYKPLRRQDIEIEKKRYKLDYNICMEINISRYTCIIHWYLCCWIGKHIYPCNVCDLNEIFWIHGIAEITKKIDDPIKYVHKCYHRETYVKCYDEGVTLLNEQNKWPKTTEPIIFPPLYKHKPRRNNKHHRGESDEAN